MGIRATPRTPAMATLVKKAWKAKKRIKAMKEKSSWPLQQAMRSRKKAPKAKLTYSPLLSRRLGRRVFMIIVVPPRPDFPPPLVWEPLLDSPTPRPRKCKRPNQSSGQQLMNA